MSESILKHKKISHLVNGEQENNIKEEKTTESNGGFVIEEKTESKRCSCGREIIAGQGKSYTCLSCGDQLCGECHFICYIGKEVVCGKCLGVYKGSPVCPRCWRDFGVEQLYVESKKQEEEQRRRETERLRYEGNQRV